MITVSQDDFFVDEELRKLRTPSVGGLVIFIGTVREEADGKEVRQMEIEVYPDMAMKQLEDIRNEAIKKFGVEDIRIIHRYGKLCVGDNIVLIAVASAHRAEAFNSCRYVIDELKKRVPIWKKEYTPDGARWVEVGRPE